MTRIKIPDKTKKTCIQLYEAGEGAKSIAETLGLNINTVNLAVKEVIRGKPSGGTAHLTNKVYRLMDMSLDQIEKKLPGASAAQAATIFGILADKREMLVNGQKQSTVNNFILPVESVSENERMELLNRVLTRTRMETAEVDEAVVIDADTE